MVLEDDLNSANNLIQNLRRSNPEFEVDRIQSIVEMSDTDSSDSESEEPTDAEIIAPLPDNQPDVAVESIDRPDAPQINRVIPPSQPTETRQQNVESGFQHSVQRK